MSIHDDDRPGDDGVTQSRTDGRQSRRGKQIAAGAVGLVVLGAGAYLTTSQVAGDDKNSTVAVDTAAGVPTAAADALGSADPAASSAPSPSVSPSASPAPSPTTARATNPAAALDPKVKREIDEAREKAAEDGVPLQRPVTAAANARASGPVKERTEKTSEGSIRIVSAKYDLTGQRELLLAADSGSPFKNARCTSKVRFSNSEKPRLLPTLLLCWRTSDSRSVVTMAVAETGKPSTDTSIAVLDKEWAKLAD